MHVNHVHFAAMCVVKCCDAVVAAMQAMLAIWRTPFQPCAPVYPEMTSSHILAIRTDMLANYASEAKKDLWCEGGSVPTKYNLLDLRSFQTLNSGGRPDLTDMTLLAPLAGCWTRLIQTIAGELARGHACEAKAQRTCAG